MVEGKRKQKLQALVPLASSNSCSKIKEKPLVSSSSSSPTLLLFNFRKFPKPNLGKYLYYSQIEASKVEVEICWSSPCKLNSFFFVFGLKVSFELTSTSLDFIDVGYEFLALVHMHLLLVWIELVNIRIFSVWVQFFEILTLMF